MAAAVSSRATKQHVWGDEGGSFCTDATPAPFGYNYSEARLAGVASGVEAPWFTHEVHQDHCLKQPQ